MTGSEPGTSGPGIRCITAELRSLLLLGEGARQGEGCTRPEVDESTRFALLNEPVVVRSVASALRRCSTQTGSLSRPVHALNWHLPWRVYPLTQYMAPDTHAAHKFSV